MRGVLILTRFAGFRYREIRGLAWEDVELWIRAALDLERQINGG
jgi:hypothetical protein